MIPAAHRGSRSIRILLLSLRWVFLLFGILAIAYCISVFLISHTFQAVERPQFDNGPPAPSLPAQNSRPLHPVLFAPGSPIGEIVIPRLAMKDVIIQGVSAGDLRIAVGHIPGTAFPWDNGNVVLSAHRNTFFLPLRRIRTGDLISLRTRAGIFSYRVKFTQIVKPTDVAVLNSRGYPTLTLTTCYPFDYIGSAPLRFIVVAARVSPQNPRA
ncbi:MAG TPA: class D sortase [Candidatus Acidoferrum sp.]|nr:class D sortase [Candidatus Acidoferrum sp.]